MAARQVQLCTKDIQSFITESSRHLNIPNVLCNIIGEMTLPNDQSKYWTVSSQSNKLSIYKRNIIKRNLFVEKFPDNENHAIFNALRGPGNKAQFLTDETNIRRMECENGKSKKPISSDELHDQIMASFCFPCLFFCLFYLLGVCFT